MKKSNMTRRNWMGALGASALGAGLLGMPAGRLSAQSYPRVRQADRSLMPTFILWKLPRSLPPMSDFGTYPGDPTDGFCCTINPSNPSGAVPWLQQDALIPNYQANWGGRRVSQVVRDRVQRRGNAR